MLKHNCDKCQYGCMSQSVFNMHTTRCDAGLSESEERKQITTKMIKELEDDIQDN